MIIQDELSNNDRFLKAYADEKERIKNMTTEQIQNRIIELEDMKLEAKARLWTIFDAFNKEGE